MEYRSSRPLKDAPFRIVYVQRPVRESQVTPGDAQEGPAARRGPPEVGGLSLGYSLLGFSDHLRSVRWANLRIGMSSGNTIQVVSVEAIPRFIQTHSLPSTSRIKAKPRRVYPQEMHAHFNSSPYTTPSEQRSWVRFDHGSFGFYILLGNVKRA